MIVAIDIFSFVSIAKRKDFFGYQKKISNL